MMEGWEGVQAGIMAIAASPQALGVVLLGVVLGMIVGVLPGFGPPAAMALLFPLVYVLEPLQAISMLAGIFYGAKYGGAVTSILVGIPGEADAVATMLEGWPLARAGKAVAALRLAIVSSFVGGSLAVLGLVMLAPFLAELTLYFGSRGRFFLMVGALLLVAVLGQGGIRKNLAMLFLGFALSLVGLDPVHGTPRLTLGSWHLFSGFDLGAMLLGLFGIGGILSDRMEKAPSLSSIRSTITENASSTLPPDYTDKTHSPEGVCPEEQVEHAGNSSCESSGVGSLADAGRVGEKAWCNVPFFEPVRAIMAMLRGTVIGFLIGIVPSGAGVTASFTSYALEKRLSPRPEHFGKGEWTGLAGPEASNNSAAVASFAPLLLMGLPTNPVMAAMLGAIMVAGIAPGPLLPEQQPVLYWGFIFSLAMGNILLLGLGLGLSRLWGALALIPQHILHPVIMILSMVGAWVGTGDLSGPVQCAGFGVLAALLSHYKFSLSPLILAFVLSRPMETYLIQSILGG